MYGKGIIMIVEPKVRGFICMTAHPTGCKKNVLNQIDYVKKNGTCDGPKRVLIIGASTGYGLASRISATYAWGADTIGVMFEKESNGKRTATAGYYNTRAFEAQAKADGHIAKSINGDAFSQEIKDQTIACIKETFGQVDMVVYSLAAPRRTTPDGTTYSSTLKTVGEPFVEKSIDLRNNVLAEASIPPATEEEIEGTVKVMGGEDWMLWIDALKEANVLAPEAITVAYSYIGPELTYPIYYNGTIGMAKKHLHQTAKDICAKHPDVKAVVSVNKALVTQASAAIPIVPLYIAILYRVMKDAGLHEGCIEQIDRLFLEKLNTTKFDTDENGLIRMDDWEIRPDIQTEVMNYWNTITPENFQSLTDIQGYWDDFYHMFGFKIDGVDYTADVEIL
jgi:enoyl-[acyl-carrier protein] reductase/trans-2-enoyl-CoA reductase (NAD+)